MIYAKLNNLTIENIIVCDDSKIITQMGHHIKVTDLTGTPIIGGTYDQVKNKFIAPKPFESWILNENLEWESPKGPNPNILTNIWNEDLQDWETLS